MNNRHRMAVVDFVQCRSEDAKRKQNRLRESHRIHAKVTSNYFVGYDLMLGIK